MPYVECVDCGMEFFRDPGEYWRVRCKQCYFQYKNGHKRHEDYKKLDESGYKTLKEEYSKIKGFLIHNIRFLIFATHPDRNPNHIERATEVTQFFNEFKKGLLE